MHEEFIENAVKFWKLLTKVELFLNLQWTSEWFTRDLSHREEEIKKYKNKIKFNFRILFRKSTVNQNIERNRSNRKLGEGN